MSQHDDGLNDDPMLDEQFADVRAALALAVAPVAPSAGMKDALLAMIATTPQRAPLSAVVLAEVSSETETETEPARAPEPAVASGSATARAQARWFSRPAMVVAVAAAAAALFFGGVAAGGVLSPTGPSSADQLATIIAAPDVSALVSDVTGGATATLVSSESVGLSVMVFDGLPQLNDDEAYALWYITDGIATPAGLFAGDVDGTLVQVLDGTFEAGTAVGMTVEPASGSPAPTSDPIVVIVTA